MIVSSVLFLSIMPVTPCLLCACMASRLVLSWCFLAVQGGSAGSCRDDQRHVRATKTEGSRRVTWCEYSRVSVGTIAFGGRGHACSSRLGERRSVACLRLPA